MSQTPPPQDPLDFMKNMWSSMGFTLPGMATPTLDVGELDKRIADLKAVEGWLKLNLGTLQMSIQGLEMQRATLAAMQAMSQAASAPPTEEFKTKTTTPPFANPGVWPWNLMQGNPTPPEPGADGEPAPPPNPEPPTRPTRSKKS